MTILEKDPVYIAQQVKFLRKMFGLTQENLADASGLSTRTIEKVESGRHRPDEQTLRSLARALNLDVAIFRKPTPEEEAKQKADIERAIRKTVVVPTTPIRTAADFLAAFDHRHAFRFDMSPVKDEAALEIAASMGDWVRDLGDVWEDVYMSQRLEYARSFVDLCAQLEMLGYVCHMGRHGQRLRDAGKPDLIFDVGLLSILPKADAEGTRYALVQLEGRWETLEADRIKIPQDDAHG